MDPALPNAPGAPDARRWGLPDAAVGWLLANVSAVLLGSVILLVFGYGGTPSADLPITMIALTYPPLWLGFVGVPLWAASTKGRGWVRDFGVRVRAVDVAGLLPGALAQFILVPLVSWPILWLTHTDVDKLGESARELADKAQGSPLGIVLLFLTVAIGAPIAEEIFFRGLVLRALEKRWGTTVGVLGSSVIFGATHFQALQFAALTAAGLVFALLAVRSDRLGPAIFAHIAFNTVTVVNLVWKIW